MATKGAHGWPGQTSDSERGSLVQNMVKGVNDRALIGQHLGCNHGHHRQPGIPADASVTSTGSVFARRRQHTGAVRRFDAALGRHRLSAEVTAAG